MTTNSPKQFEDVIPVLLVDDISKTTTYYNDVLGFTIDFTWGEPPNFASVSRGNITINFKLSDPLGQGHSNRTGKGIDIYFCVNELDKLYEEFKAKNAKIICTPTAQDYGMKEMNVEDCNGYLLCFGEQTVH